MNAKVRASAITLVIYFMLCSLPCWNSENLQRLFPLQNQALAADQSDFEEEPFPAAEKVPDPLEPFNRAMFTVNNKIYFWAMKPVAKGYATVVPPGVRTAIDNGFQNTLAPIRIVNSLLQGKMKIMGIEMARLVINSTMGFGGLFDIAKTHFNLETHKEDTGQTLGVYGMKPIMYLYWPVLGASSLRDTIGTVGDVFMIPIYYFTPDILSSLAITAGGIENGLSLRLGEYEDFLKSALDPYAAVRNAYLQHRQEEISK